MIIIVTGTSGAGKTVIAKKIARKYNLNYIDLGEIIKKYKLYSSYDKKLKTYLVDVKKLNKFMVKWIKKNKKIVIDSHLSHYINKKYVDLCIVVKCSLPGLKKRLKKKGYSERKIRENLDAEIFDTCLIEALESGYKVYVIDTTQGLNKKDLNLPL